MWLVEDVAVLVDVVDPDKSMQTTRNVESKDYGASKQRICMHCINLQAIPNAREANVLYVYLVNTHHSPVTTKGE